MKNKGRREFFRELAIKTTCWIPGLNLLGFRLHCYTNPVSTGWHGWITWYGKLVGFLRLNRTIVWWP